MKRLVFLILMISPFIGFGQLGVNDLIQIYNMDFDQFENYCVKRGFELFQIEEHPDVNGMYYKKGKGINTRYIGLFDKFKNQGVKVKYQTSISSEVVTLKQQIKNLGFILIKSESFKSNIGSMTHRSIYKNKLYSIDIYTIPPDGTESFPSYEIGLTSL
jgi:hypothetical protein